MRAEESTVKEFQKRISDLKSITRSAIKTSAENIGLHHTGRQNRALFLFAKIIAHNLSLIRIIEADQSHRNYDDDEFLLDHFSVAALARTIIDACVMMAYISHPSLSRDEWNLRRYILYLHDAMNRKRFFNPVKTNSDSFLLGYDDQKRYLIEKIQKYASVLSVSDEKSAELIKGQIVYVDGVRGAVREAGWPLDEFEFAQSYLSAFVHSHPVSFMRAAEHGISFSKPSDFQVTIATLAIGFSVSYTHAIVERMKIFAKTADGDILGRVDD